MAHDCSSYQIKLPYITLPLEYNITYYFDGFVQLPFQEPYLEVPST